MSRKKVFFLIILAVIILVIFNLIKKLDKIGKEQIGNDIDIYASNKDYINITEKYFVSQLDEVYINIKDYMGKTISYEGYIANLEKENMFVVGREFYCCGFDAYLVGFECEYDKEKYENDEWVRVTGVMDTYIDENGRVIPMVKVTDILKIPEGNRVVMY